MKALVLTDINTLEYQDVSIPKYRNDEILVRVKACAICGSDVHGMDGSTGRRIPPIIMGHEASGIVEAIGSEVKDFSVGDRITFDSTIYCNNCYFCKKGRINLCDNRRVIGVSCNEYRQNGAFAEYIVIPQHIAYHLPEDISFEQAAMVEPVSIAVHAVGQHAVSLNSSAAVVGVGLIGLLVVQILRIVGCSQIIAIDLEQNRLEMAHKFGATHCILANQENLFHQVLNITQGRGVDYAYEAVGISSTVLTAINILCKGGSLTLIGNLKPQIDFPLQSIVTREITIYGSCASDSEYPISLDLIKDGKINVDSLISKVAPLKDGSIWFKKLYNKEAGLMKVILLT